MRDPFNGSKFPILVPLFLMGAVAVWYWLWNVDVLDYGPPQATHFDVPEAPAGAEIHICFDRVTWKKICQSKFVQQVTCLQNGPGHPGTRRPIRLDLQSHEIDAPPQSGPIPSKCRRFTVPSECLPGLLKFTGYAESECAPFGSWNKRYSYPPVLELKVLPGNVSR